MKRHLLFHALARFIEQRARPRTSLASACAWGNNNEAGHLFSVFDRRHLVNSHFHLSNRRVRIEASAVSRSEFDTYGVDRKRGKHRRLPFQSDSGEQLDLLVCISTTRPGAVSDLAACNDAREMWLPSDSPSSSPLSSSCYLLCSCSKYIPRTMRALPCWGRWQRLYVAPISFQGPFVLWQWDRGEARSFCATPCAPARRHGHDSSPPPHAVCTPPATTSAGPGRRCSACFGCLW